MTHKLWAEFYLKSKLNQQILREPHQNSNMPFLRNDFFKIFEDRFTIK